KVHTSAADDVTGIGEHGFQSICDIEPLVVIHFHKMVPAFRCIILCVERLEIWLALECTALVLVFNFIFLNLGRVFKKNVCEFPRCGCAEYLSGESFLHEFRQQSAVVDVGMREHHGVDLERIESKMPVQVICITSKSLEHSAIE